MIVLIHGEDTASSRAYLMGFKLKFIRLDATSDDLAEMTQVLEGSSLFSESQNVLIENLFSKKTKNLSQIISLINQTQVNVYIYETKAVSKSNISKLKGTRSELFEYPKTLFSFLDGIVPDNRRAIELFRNAIKTTNEEILLFMIVRQFRLMIGLSHGARIDEVLRLAPWQKSKLLSQAQFFGKDRLRENYKKIFQIDLEHKTGMLPLPLTKAIDIWLSNL